MHFILEPHALQMNSFNLKVRKGVKVEWDYEDMCKHKSTVAKLSVVLCKWKKAISQCTMDNLIPQFEEENEEKNRQIFFIFLILLNF